MDKFGLFWQVNVPMLSLGFFDLKSGLMSAKAGLMGIN